MEFGDLFDSAAHGLGRHWSFHFPLSKIEQIANIKKRTVTCGGRAPNKFGRAKIGARTKHRRTGEGVPFSPIFARPECGKIAKLIFRTGTLASSAVTQQGKFVQTFEKILLKSSSMRLTILLNNS